MLFVGCICLIVVFLFFCVFKFWVVGNNKIVEDVDDLDEYFLGMKNYRASCVVSVVSNKNENTYRLSQVQQDGALIQEVVDADTGEGVVIECAGNRVIVRNTALSLEKVFDMYGEMFNSSMGLDAFIEDYVADSRREVREENGYFIVSVKAKNSQNKYSKSKVLYFNRESNSIEKIVVKDINNKDLVIIEYISLEIL